MKPMLSAAACLAVAAAAWSTGGAQTAVTYRTPPAAIEQSLDAPLIPLAVVSPNRMTLLVKRPGTTETHSPQTLSRQSRTLSARSNGILG